MKLLLELVSQLLIHYEVSLKLGTEYYVLRASSGILMCLYNVLCIRKDRREFAKESHLAYPDQENLLRQNDREGRRFLKTKFFAAHKCTMYNGVLTSLIFFCSGTLSYIFNNFIGSRTFSEVVTEAKQAGYTEPDPRDDLSGTDVRRKVRSTQSLHDIVT